MKPHTGIVVEHGSNRGEMNKSPEAIAQEILDERFSYTDVLELRPDLTLEGARQVIEKIREVGLAESSTLFATVAFTLRSVNEFELALLVVDLKNEVEATWGVQFPEISRDHMFERIRP